MNMSSTNDSLRAALVGYGQMGHEIERLADAGGVQITERIDADHPLNAAAWGTFDVAIEFTSPDSAVANIRTLAQHGVPTVVGTTGWLAHLDEVRAITREHEARVLYGSNFSIGVNILFRLVREAGRLFDEQAMYDAAVHEIHHTRKADSPSGTAITIGTILLETLARKTSILADAAHERIDPAALHVSSQRLGATVGTHIVSFDSEADIIELTHRAKNRSGFALGALMAARWIVEQPPGLYRFEDLFGG